jgi:hypothetical protein
MKLRLFYGMMLALCVLDAQGAEVVWFDGQHPITYQMPKDVEHC